MPETMYLKIKCWHYWSCEEEVEGLWYCGFRGGAGSTRGWGTLGLQPTLMHPPPILLWVIQPPKFSTIINFLYFEPCLFQLLNLS